MERTDQDYTMLLRGLSIRRMLRMRRWRRRTLFSRSIRRFCGRWVVERTAKRQLGAMSAQAFEVMDAGSIGGAFSEGG